MNSFVIPTAVICTYGFFACFKPSEPFLTLFLVSPYKNLTEEVANNEIYPVWTYSYLAVQFVVFLIADFTRYKIVIVLQSLMVISTWALLIWAQGVFLMQIMQFFYGVSSAAEIAYYSYIYAVIQPEYYKIAAGCTRAVTLVSRCLAGILAQILISNHYGTYMTLNIISFASVCLSFFVALVLPRVEHSDYFHDKKTGTEEENLLNTVCAADSVNNDSASRLSFTSTTSAVQGYDSFRGNNPEMHHNTDVYSLLGPSCSDNSLDYLIQNTSKDKEGEIEFYEKRHTICDSFVNALKMMAKDFVTNYSRKVFVVWCIWWAIATCGDLQVLNYIQNLWDVIDSNSTLNGVIEAAAMLTASGTSLGISLAPGNWEVYGELLLAVVSAVNSVNLIIMCRTNVIWISYVFYILFRASYQMVITVATFQIAKHLTVQRYGLVFGFNTFVALFLQMILTVIVVDKRGLHLGIRTQFLINGGYFGVMGLVFFVSSIVTLRRAGCAPCYTDTKS